MKEIVIPLPEGIDSSITDRVKRLAAEHWGGFTEMPAAGGWESPNGEIITEPVNVLTVVASDEHDRDGTTPEQWARTTARVVAKESDESQVLWFVRQLAAGGFEE